MRYQELDLNRIKADQRFSLRVGNDDCPPELYRSLTDVGLITPLLVLEEDNGYILVHGRRRLSGLVDAGVKKAACAIIDKKTPLEKILSRLIAEHSVSGPMSPGNIAMLLNLAHPLDEERRNGLLLRAGVNPRHQPAAAFTALLELKPEARRAMDNGTIAPTTALTLFKLTPGARDLICRIITALKLSRQAQKELIAATMELARRQRQDEAETAMEIWRHCESCEGNPPQKGAALKRFLTEHLYPRTTAAKLEFNTFANRLKLPKNATLTPAPAFESDRLTLKLTFKNRDELKRFWQDAKENIAPTHQ